MGHPSGPAIWRLDEKEIAEGPKDGHIGPHWEFIHDGGIGPGLGLKGLAAYQSFQSDGVL